MPHDTPSEDRLFFFEPQTLTLDDFPAEGPILDIGGGGEGIIGRLKGSQVVSIDSSKQELEEAGPGPLKIVMDAENLQFLDNTFNVVTAFFTMMYVRASSHAQVFEEIYRVLAPGGQFLLWDFELPPRAGQPQDIPAFMLTINLPGEQVETGYGTRWPDAMQGINYYVQLAAETGFVVEVQEKTGQHFFLGLRKRH